MDSLGDIWKIIYLGFRNPAQCDAWFSALYKYSYLLLTYHIRKYRQ